MSDGSRVVIVGAGVIGLSTALQLSRQNKHLSITVVAKHMPGDYDAEYASPWAGANYLPLAAEGTLQQKLERETWPYLEHLARELPEAGIHFQTAKLYTRKQDSSAPDGVDAAVRKVYESRSSSTPWFGPLMPGFRMLAADELNGYDSGTTFTSVVINTALYLPYLASQCLKNGVVVRRGILNKIADAANAHHTGSLASVVVNCTGLGSRFLLDVLDKSVKPARGQIVVVRNEPGVLTSTSSTDDGPEESCYVMGRAAGGGSVIGGCYQTDNWDPVPDPNLAVRIMARAVKLVPALTGGKGIEHLSIVRHAVGFRPTRENGTRIERETIDGVRVVHCYGHGGFGYQASWGSAIMASALVEECLGDYDNANYHKQ